MRILAVADVHSPRYYEEFVGSLDRCEAPDIFLMAGDMVNRGTAVEFARVLDAIDNAFGRGFPIVSCFGNEEYSESRSAIISVTGGRVMFLDEKSEIFKLGGKALGVVGTQGSLDKPTEWQRRNLPNIKSVFQRRASRAASLLRRLNGKADYSILLMHYSPCLETCMGEEERSFSWLGSRKFYSVVKNERPDLVIHGHVHNSTVHESKIGPTLVRNVAFPATRCLTELNVLDSLPVPCTIETPSQSERNIE